MKKSKAETSDWIVGWFKKKGRINEKTDLNHLKNSNFFEAGVIDSLGVIELITEIEGEFKVRFTHNHFQDPRFTTIQGLSEIISDLQAGTKVSS